MTEVFHIRLSDGHNSWAKAPYPDWSSAFLWGWIKEGNELQVQDQRPRAADLAQPDFGVPVSFNPDHIICIARFPVYA